METNGNWDPSTVQLFLLPEKPEFLRGISRATKNTLKWNSPLPGGIPHYRPMVAIIWRMGFRKEHNVSCPIGIQSPLSVDDGLGCPSWPPKCKVSIYRFHKTSLKRWGRISRVLRRLRFSGQKRCRVPRLRRCSIITALRQWSKICCKWS